MCNSEPRPDGDARERDPCRLGTLACLYVSRFEFFESSFRGNSCLKIEPYFGQGRAGAGRISFHRRNPASTSPTQGSRVCPKKVEQSQVLFYTTLSLCTLARSLLILACSFSQHNPHPSPTCCLAHRSLDTVINVNETIAILALGHTVNFSFLSCLSLHTIFPLDAPSAPPPPPPPPRHHCLSSHRFAGSHLSLWLPRTSINKSHADLVWLEPPRLPNGLPSSLPTQAQASAPPRPWLARTLPSWSTSFAQNPISSVHHIDPLLPQTPTMQPN